MAYINGEEILFSVQVTELSGTGDIHIEQTTGDSTVKTMSQKAITDIYNRNSNRIDNLEARLSDDVFITDDSVAYKKTVPLGVAPYAAINRVGGETHSAVYDYNLIPYPYINTGGTERNHGVLEVGGNYAEFIITLGGGTVYPAGTYIYEVGQNENVESLGVEFSNYGASVPTITKITNYEYRIASDSNFSITKFTVTVGYQVAQTDIYPMFYPEVKPITWQPRGQAMLHHAKVTAIKSKGISIWDEQWEFGSYGSNGEPIEQSGIRSKAENYITVEPSTDYYIYNGTSSWIVLLFYDANKQYISSAEVQSAIRTTPSNAKYIRFRLSSDYGTTYNNNVSIYKSDAAINGKYYPYVGTIDTFTIPEAVQAIEGYGLGIDTTYHNTIEYLDSRVRFVRWVKESVITQVGYVAWASEGYSNVDYYAFKLPTDYVGYATDAFLLEGFNEKPSHSNWDSADFIGVATGLATEYEIWVGFPKATTQAEAEAALLGKSFVYALATPEVTDITDLMPADNFIKVESGGSIEAVNEYERDVHTNITYQKEE